MTIREGETINAPALAAIFSQIIASNRLAQAQAHHLTTWAHQPPPAAADLRRRYQERAAGLTAGTDPTEALHPIQPRQPHLSSHPLA